VAGGGRPDHPAAIVTFVAVDSADQREAARSLIAEYLGWIAEIAGEQYGLTFDIDAMVHSDVEDPHKFFPPTGRFYLVEHDGRYVGVGCLKQLSPQVAELQRMYVQPHARGIGAGRALLMRLLHEARAMGYQRVRLESLKALTPAHQLYRSVGFRDVDPYPDNSMKDYQSTDALDAYRRSAVFMELDLR
jgi:GNAT superfamily N-acetyltransferase